MPPRSKIYKLPKQIKEAIDKLILSNKFTNKEIADRINSLLDDEFVVSEASVCRYSRKINDAGDRIRTVRELAKVWATDFEESDISKLTVEQLSVMIFDIMCDLQKSLDASDKPEKMVRIVNELSNALMRLNQAKKSTQDYDDKKMKMYKDATKEELKNFGIDEEGIKSAINRIYGGSN